MDKFKQRSDSETPGMLNFCGESKHQGTKNRFLAWKHGMELTEKHEMAGSFVCPKIAGFDQKPSPHPFYIRIPTLRLAPYWPILCHQTEYSGSF